MSELIHFESRRVGPIEVPASDVVTFEPLPGFPNRTRFVLMEHAPDSPLAWLVSLDDPDLAFVVASPWTFFPQYDPPVEREHLAVLGIERREDVELLCIVTLSGKEIFLNLAAPVVVNAANRKGMQVVTDDPRYTTRAPLPELRPAESETPATEAASPAPTPAASPAAR
ncbi:MAG: flagellar assembly protein FliW [Myxococcota bacterium]